MSGITRSRIKYEKTCLHCKSTFSVPFYRKDTALYCGRSCMALHSRSEVHANCEQCGTSFTHISSRANKAKYCSTTCYYKSLRHKGTVEYTCQHCSKIFNGSPSHKRKYCSISCTNKSKKGIWKPSFETVRKNMLRRNMITFCNRCGYDEHKSILGVHHKDRNPRNNDLSNLEVLCPNCHSLEHARHISHAHTFKE